MRLSLRGICATLGAVALVGTMAIGAATPTHAASAPFVVVSAAPGVAPNTNIIISRTTHKAVYHPRTLNGGAHVSTCSTATENITVNDETTASQTITYQGSNFYTLAPEGAVGICFFVAGTYTFSLSSNTRAKLTVTIS